MKLDDGQVKLLTIENGEQLELIIRDRDGKQVAGRISYTARKDGNPSKDGTPGGKGGTYTFVLPMFTDEYILKALEKSDDGKNP